MLKLFLLLFPILVFSRPVSDHFDGSKFFNPGKNNHHTIWDIIKWQVFGDASVWPDHVPNRAWPFLMIAPQNRAVVTFINHATFLIQLKGLTVITDPIFSERASPFKFIGPKRARGPGIELEELPPIDVVLISHNHYDHMDLDSLKKLNAKFRPLFLVPLGDEKFLKEAGIQNVREMDWWETQEVKGIHFHFTPAQHWSGRGLFDKQESLWGGHYIVSEKIKIFFAGDTGLSDHFLSIKDKLGPPDLSLLPIGSYAPRSIMEIGHLTPEEAHVAHQDLESKFSLGMHFGTFQLTDEPISEPVERLMKINSRNFTVLDQGESRAF